jgi:hypothetical protein
MADQRAKSGLVVSARDKLAEAGLVSVDERPDER